MGDWDPERIKALMQAAGMAYGAPPPVDATAIEAAPPVDASATEAETPDVAHLGLNYEIPSGVADVGPIQIDRPPVAPVAPPPVDTSNMTDAQYADWLQSQGAKTLRDDSGKWLMGGRSPDLILGAGGSPLVLGGGPPPPKAGGDNAPPTVTFSGGGGSGSSSGPLGLGAPQYATIPGHDVPQVSPETREMLMSGPKAELGAANAQAGADQAKVDAAREAAMQRAQAYDELVRQSAQREAQRQSVLRQQEDDMNRVADQVARTQIDPDHLWKSKNAGQMVAGWVAAVLAGYKSGKFGGPNEVLQRIDQEIDRDIAAQKANYEIKRGKLTDLRTLYGQKMARFQDERTAEAAAKADMLSSVLARGDAMAANADSEQVTANWMKERARIADKRGALETTINKWVPQQTVQVGGASAMGAGTVEGQPINIGDGKFLIANGPVAPELAKKIAAAAAIQTGLQRLAGLYKQRGATDKLGGDQSAINQQINQELANIGQQRTVFEGQGAMSAGDKVVSDTANGVLKGLADFTGDPTQLVNQAIRDIGDQKDQYARAIGGRVYRNAGVQRTAKGELKEQWIATPEFYGDATASTATPPPSVKMDGK